MNENVNRNKIEVKFILNDKKVSLQVSAQETLLEMLREKLGIKSPKCGCDLGDCGACTVFLDGVTVRSCLVLAAEMNNREVLTLEGLMKRDANAKDGLTDLQRYFLNKNSFQCGYCAPGVILSATELLQKNPHPSKEEIQEGLSGNLCRCTGYKPIIDAVTECANDTNL
ncbi:MAG: (2Fe-2S)-binding protein [Oligoflexia bacterium]|nr:(2Fe-2S)-binding protein [Oligoflexia bacterium]